MNEAILLKKSAFFNSLARCFLWLNLAILNKFICAGYDFVYPTTINFYKQKDFLSLSFFFIGRNFFLTYPNKHQHRLPISAYQKPMNLTKSHEFDEKQIVF